MTLKGVSVTGTQKEMSRLHDLKYHVRYFVRVDADRYLVTIRVPEGFVLGKTKTIVGLIRKLKGIV